MKYLIDSSAWVEYVEGTKIGEKINNILKSGEEIFVVAINIAEVVSIIKRKGKNHQTAYEAIMKNAKIIDITPQVSKEAGILHAEMKTKNPSFSLADALIIKSAESISAKILTKDAHFKNFKSAIII